MNIIYIWDEVFESCPSFSSYIKDKIERFIGVWVSDEELTYLKLKYEVDCVIGNDITTYVIRKQ